MVRGQLIDRGKGKPPMGDQILEEDLSLDINPQFSRLGNAKSAIKMGTTKETASQRALKII